MTTKVNFKQIHASTQATEEATTNTTSSAGRTDKKKATKWINVGKTVQLPNPETGVPEDVFISLPLGIAFDDTQLTKFKTTDNERYKQILTLRNKLIQQINAMFDGIEQGGTAELKLECELRKVADQVTEVESVDGIEDFTFDL